MKVYVVVENSCGILNHVAVYKKFSDAKAHFDSCIDEDFVEINLDIDYECLYARDNDDCDYEISVWPTELN